MGDVADCSHALSIKSLGSVPRLPSLRSPWIYLSNCVRDAVNACTVSGGVDGNNDDRGVDQCDDSAGGDEGCGRDDVYSHKNVSRVLG